MSELTELRARFDALEPEIDEVISDPAIDLEGYVVVWNTNASIGGPLEHVGKGGTRITPTVDQNEVRQLARTMTLKNAAAGIPLGGAKSGVRGNPDEPGFEKKYKRFIELSKPLLAVNGGGWGGVGFDLGGRPEQLVWACDVLGRNDCATGKTLEMGGTDYDVEGIAGYGVAFAAEALLSNIGEPIDGVTFAVQGLGAMGAAVFRFMTELGATASHLSDPMVGGTWQLPTDISDELVNAITRRDLDVTKVLLAAECEGPKPLEEVLSAETDILFPCAMGHVIDSLNVNRLQCKYLIEGANFPTEESAYEALVEKSILVVPDIIANPGGIIAAFVELTVDVSVEENVRNRVKPEAAKDMTRERISANVDELMQLVQAGMEPHAAAELMALRRIFP